MAKLININFLRVTCGQRCPIIRCKIWIRGAQHLTFVKGNSQSKKYIPIGQIINSTIKLMKSPLFRPKTNILSSTRKSYTQHTCNNKKYSFVGNISYRIAKYVGRHENQLHKQDITTGQLFPNFLVVAVSILIVACLQLRFVRFRGLPFFGFATDLSSLTVILYDSSWICFLHKPMLPLFIIDFRCCPKF